MGERMISIYTKSELAHQPFIVRIRVKENKPFYRNIFLLIGGSWVVYGVSPGFRAGSGLKQA